MIPRSRSRKEIGAAVKRLFQQENYMAAYPDCLVTMLRGRDTSPIALAYVADMESVGRSALKKELIIFARGRCRAEPAGRNRAITLIKDDPEVKKSLICSCRTGTRRRGSPLAKVLETMKADPDALAAARKRKLAETDSEVKKVLERILT